MLAPAQRNRIVWQAASVRRWHHEDSRWPQAVTGLTDEAGVRYGSYAYDAQGRVTRSELAGGTERLDFGYGIDANAKPTTTVTDYTGAGGAATSRSYTFTDIGNTRYPASLTAPCSLCGSTQQSSSHDANGNPTRQIAHDGSVTFFAYDAKGRETERASYNTAATRPALGGATKVVSTKWHASFNLPTQVAEPNKVTASTYNAKGMLTGESWTATTDATGAAKFSAVKTGSTYATGWSYSASSLATTVVTRETAAGSTTATETGRWTYAYDAQSNLKTARNVRIQPNPTSTFSTYSAHGLPLSGQTFDGRTFQIQYRVTGEVDRVSLSDGYAVQYSYSPTRKLLKGSASDGWTATVSYDVSGYVNGTVTSQVAAAMPSALMRSALTAASTTAATGVDAIPAPVPMPDWDAWGRASGRLAGACLSRLGVLALLLTPSTTSACDTVVDRPDQCKKICPPCRTVSGKFVPLGTIAYRPLDIPPPGRTQHGITGPHHNIYKANQNPNNCQCFWQSQGAVPEGGLPPGSIPIEQFAN